MEIIIYLTIAILSFIAGAVCCYKLLETLEEKPFDEITDRYPKCSCRDCTQCDLWCAAKERFTRDHP